jgi:hypothetical protein
MDEQRNTPFLNPEEEQELLALHRSMKDKRKAYRINAIILLNRGYTKTEVERILLIDRKSLLKHEKNYRKGGIEKLLRDDYIFYTGKLSEHEKLIRKRQPNPIWTESRGNAIIVNIFMEVAHGIEKTTWERSAEERIQSGTRERLASERTHEDRIRQAERDTPERFIPLDRQAQ